MSDSSTTTEIPKNFDYATAQPRIYQAWQDAGYFHAEPDPNRQPYSIVIPPPNVTGALHLGHALNNTLQDICIRMKRMQGFNAMWMPGTDHAGIATQAVVEKRLKEDENKTRHDLGREKLVERIWDWKEQYEKRILGQLKQIGSSCDWERTRFTLDETCARAVRTTFFDLFKKDLIYRGKKLVNWDTFLQTAVSDDEVFHEEVKGHFWHYRYPVIDPKPGEPEFVTIATTRPETMLGDTAVAVHPDPAKQLDKVEAELKEKLAKANEKETPEIEKQIEAIGERRTMLASLEQLAQMAADGRMLKLPLTDREIPLIADVWAKPELGSGCVKVTPAHDPNDYEVWQRNTHIGQINILNPDGTLNENAGAYKGLTMKKARKQVVADLEEQGLMDDIEDRLIELGHSDRSKTPIEPYLADQWFVRMDTLAQSAMDAVTDGRVKIYPERYAKSYLDWLSEKRDWPVGRQLWWGHRIPIWTTNCGRETALIETLNRVNKLPGRTPDNLVVQWELNSDHQDAVARGDKFDEMTFPYASVHLCPDPNDSDLISQIEDLWEYEQDQDGPPYKIGMFIQEEDVLDTWFSSALWPHSTLGWPEKNDALDYWYPTSVLITSRDIITLWVARMVLMGLNNMDEIPFREVFIHPKILDGYGETMSKSKGNGVDPLDIIEKFGADALRFGLAYLTTETQDVKMPVQFECPSCNTLVEQTKKNRELPRIECKKCKEPFSTQWASTEEDLALPRGPVVSERFEQGRNFCNKLWNASRFALMNLEGYTPADVDDADLTTEDRWLLSRLNTVTQQVTEAMEKYHYSDAARALYDFAWDEFCSFYVEISKARFQDEATKPMAQRVLAHALDTLLRLLHPIIPFITEEVWHLLARAAPQRGLTNPAPGTESIMLAPWPTFDAARQDAKIESQFARFQAAIGAIREIRSRQNLNKESVNFCIKCDEETATLLKPMEPYIASMANATATSFGPDVSAPEINATITAGDMEVFVDLDGLIDTSAEIARLEKQEQQITKQIGGKEGKLSNKSFVDRAPADVVARERESLEQLKAEVERVRADLKKLQA